MSNAIPYLIQGKNIVMVIDGKSHTVTRDTHINYEKIVDAIKALDWDAVRDLVEPKKAIIDFGLGHVSIKGETVYWGDREFHNSLASRMIEMYREGFSIDPMVRFMENLMQNPSMRSVDQLYGFLEKNRLPITEDGYFLAYKRVRHDYKDKHTGTIDNSIGAFVEMERNQVDDNPNSTCSFGLHFCSEEYLGHFGSADEPVMILKINPADVVSIPTDYNDSKGRCAAYEVVGQVNGPVEDTFTSAVNTQYARPESAWPFDTQVDDSQEEDDFDPELLDEDLYDVVRVYGGDLVVANVTLEEAEALVEKNVRQKQAQLKIVIAGTDEEV